MLFLDIKALKRSYTTGSVRTDVLDGVDLTVAPGEFIAIMGPSGSGKTTLLNLIGLLDRADHGRLLLNGQNVMGLGERALTRLRRNTIGFVFQRFDLIEELTVRENVALGLLYHRISLSERRTRIAEAMDRVAVAHRAEFYPSQLSGGMQQRVAIARAVVARPPLILADEPTGNLDSRNGEDVLKLLSSLNADGATVLMVTHSPRDADQARRIVEMLDGRVLVERRRTA